MLGSAARASVCNASPGHCPAPPGLLLPTRSAAPTLLLLLPPPPTPTHTPRTTCTTHRREKRRMRLDFEYRSRYPGQAKAETPDVGPLVLSAAHPPAPLPAGQLLAAETKLPQTAAALAAGPLALGAGEAAGVPALAAVPSFAASTTAAVPALPVKQQPPLRTTSGNPFAAGGVEPYNVVTNPAVAASLEATPVSGGPLARAATGFGRASGGLELAPAGVYMGGEPCQGAAAARAVHAFGWATGRCLCGTAAHLHVGPAAWGESMRKQALAWFWNIGSKGRRDCILLTLFRCGLDIPCQRWGTRQLYDLTTAARARRPLPWLAALPSAPPAVAASYDAAQHARSDTVVVNVNQLRMSGASDVAPISAVARSASLDRQQAAPAPTPDYMAAVARSSAAAPDAAAAPAPPAQDKQAQKQASEPPCRHPALHLHMLSACACAPPCRQHPVCQHFAAQKALQASPTPADLPATPTLRPSSPPQIPSQISPSLAFPAQQELLQAVAHEEYDEGDLDPEWQELLSELDARLRRAGKPAMSARERAVAIR